MNPLIVNFGYNERHFLAEPKFVISEAWGEPAELSTLFEHERADVHTTLSTVSSHCEGLVALVLSPLTTYYVSTTYSTAY